MGADDNGRQEGLPPNEGLPLQFNLNQFNRATKVLGIVFEGIHVHDLPCLRLNVFALSIGVCEPENSSAQF